MRTMLLLVTTLVVLGAALQMAGVVEARPLPGGLPCLVGHSYWDGCVLCVPPENDAGCGCAPECFPP